MIFHKNQLGDIAIASLSKISKSSKTNPEQFKKVGNLQKVNFVEQRSRNAKITRKQGIKSIQLIRLFYGFSERITALFTSAGMGTTTYSMYINSRYMLRHTHLTNFINYVMVQLRYLFNCVSFLSYLTPKGSYRIRNIRHFNKYRAMLGVLSKPHKLNGAIVE